MASDKHSDDLQSTLKSNIWYSCDILQPCFLMIVHILTRPRTSFEVPIATCVCVCVCMCACVGGCACACGWVCACARGCGCVCKWVGDNRGREREPKKNRNSIKVWNLVSTNPPASFFLLTLNLSFFLIFVELGLNYFFSTNKINKIFQKTHFCTLFGLKAYFSKRMTYQQSCKLILAFFATRNPFQDI